jgi:hypothetical protein
MTSDERDKPRDAPEGPDLPERLRRDALAAEVAATVEREEELARAEVRTSELARELLEIIERDEELARLQAHTPEPEAGAPPRAWKQLIEGGFDVHAVDAERGQLAAALDRRDPGWRARCGAGSLGEHEARRLAQVFADMIGRHLVPHPAVLRDAERYALARLAVEALARLDTPSGEPPPSRVR